MKKSLKNSIKVLLITLIAICNSQAQQIVEFKVSLLTPDEIINSGGAFTLTDDSPVSLFLHTRELSTVQPDAYGFHRLLSVEISNMQNLLARYRDRFPNMANADVYFYLFSSAPNIIDTRSVLRQYTYWPPTNPWYGLGEPSAAIGTLFFSQVAGWFVIESGTIDPIFHENPHYDGFYYNNLTIAEAEDVYEFAGFPSEHPAWRQEPWLHYAIPECQNPHNQRQFNNSSKNNLSTDRYFNLSDQCILERNNEMSVKLASLRYFFRLNLTRKIIVTIF
ncbi:MULTISPECIES: enterotoxin A family protein [unclassified Shewanella]|uniref:enterotoxin A family protein n=1 Tax=unclassified Shewanella TaxID=196818 RepID=UPI001BBB58AF|nr:MULTISPECIES: enterotoxin A family protein [unclassified Shewanella]GIU05659.1 cholera enterotoxin subunit A [Shewanella sp. MBTL60-112-B1]GIU23732.1 cholera enterotoxin subunit A [Shewanella sp. MBTL60-112-B2]